MCVIHTRETENEYWVSVCTGFFRSLVMKQFMVWFPFYCVIVSPKFQEESRGQESSDFEPPKTAWDSWSSWNPLGPLNQEWLHQPRSHTTLPTPSFIYFYFLIEFYWSRVDNDVVLFSGIQQRESVIYTSIHSFFPSRWLQTIASISLFSQTSPLSLSCPRSRKDFIWTNWEYD